MHPLAMSDQKAVYITALKTPNANDHAKCPPYVYQRTIDVVQERKERTTEQRPRKGISIGDPP
jgi:hypothetical protein